MQAAQRRNFVSNTLVVIVPSTAANAPKAVADLAQAAYQRIAIGLPASVPVGRYTKGVLEAAGHWAAIEPKMIGANNVRQALDYVARAEVDAGFVYATDAALMPDKVKVALTVPTTTPILYPVAPLPAGPNAAMGAALRRLPAVARPRRPCSPSTASASPETARAREWRRMGRTGTDAQGGAVGHGVEPVARRGRRLCDGALALCRPRSARRGASRCRW